MGISRIVFVIVSVVWSSVSMADLIAFDEATDGDISSSSGNPVFVFDEGLNVIEGSSQIAGGLTGANDWDYFQFVLGDGLFLASVTFEFSGGLTPDSDEPLARMVFRIGDSSGACGLGPSPNILDAGAGTTTYDSCSFGVLNWSDLGPGTYYLRHGLASSSNGTTGDSWNYTLTFDVQRSVPEPGTLALLSVGLLGVGMSRRRRCRPA